MDMKRYNTPALELLNLTSKDILLISGGPLSDAFNQPDDADFGGVGNPVTGDGSIWG